MTETLDRTLAVAPGSTSGTAAPLRRSWPWTFVLAVVLGAAVSRGAMEIAVGKTLAYGVQFATLGSALLLLGVFGGARRSGYRRPAWLIGYLFLLVASLSMLCSSVFSSISYSAPYVAVMLVYVAAMLFTCSTDFAAARGVAVGPAFAAVAVTIIAFAVAQQHLGFTVLPGSDFGTFGTTARPSSTTGSFLHYPIALALIAFVLLAAGAAGTGRAYTILGMVACAAVVASYSRSGLVLLCTGLAFGILQIRAVTAKIAALALLVAAAPWLSAMASLSGYLDRAMSIFSPTGAGNEIRIEQWRSALALWVDSPMLVGAHTGQFTNVTSNAGVDVGVVESGVLQQLVNFGLVGMLVFYTVIILLFRSIPREQGWLRAGVLGAVVQSFFYQSIEVFPFMAILVLYPIAAQRFQASIPQPLHLRISA